MKYKVGDKVQIKSIHWYNENKNADGCVHCGDRVFDNYMTVFCGSIVTIGGVGLYGYDILEDMHCSTWTDEMIECKVEEETKPKYEDEVNGEYYSTPKYLVRPNGYQFVDENGKVINAQKIVLEKLVVPKFKKGDKIKDKNNKVWYVAQVGNKHFDISRVPDGPGYFIPMEDQDDYELVPDIELPKTFEDCVSVLMREGGNRMSLEQMNTFRKLIDARNAYWTIYGKENGLGKPWEPDWNDEKQDKYGFYDEVKYTIINPAIFVFPTEEMRDAFKENFNPDIEICKKLL